MSTLVQPIFRSPSQAPPEDFDPSKASDSDLEKYFYPPRPDPVKEPLEYASWESFSVQKPKYVASELVELPEGGLNDRETWAGAYILAPKEANEKLFRAVQGTWTVPTIIPRDNTDEDDSKKSYRSANWVGIDGWDNKVSLKVGVLSRIEVQGQNIAKPVHTAMIAYRNSDGIDQVTTVGFDNFPVHTGDEITARVWGPPGTIECHGAIWNLTQRLWVTAFLRPINPTPLQGYSALWVFAGTEISDRIKFPHFEPFSYSNLRAHQVDDTEAKIIDVFQSQTLPIFVELNKLKTSLFFQDKSG